MSRTDFRGRDEAEFEDDLRARQRNIVFPDTVRNEGIFYRELVQGKRSLNRIQRIGVLVLAASLILFGTMPFVSAVNGWRSVPEHKLLNAYRDFFAPGLFTLLSILLLLLGAKLMRVGIRSPKSLKTHSFLDPKG